MTSDAPGPGQPGSGLPPEPDAQPPSTGEWPAELVPPPAAPEAPAPAPAAPEPPAGAPAPTPATTSGTWGTPAAPAAPAAPASDSAGASSGTWGTTQSSGTWGSPPAAQPAPAPDAAAPAAPPVPQTPPATTWGQPATPVAPAPAQPQAWGAAATPPPADGGWGAPPATPGQPGAAGGPGAWGAPPAQPGGWAPGPGVPGAPPPGSWAPAPAKSGNGCLKACLIVGVILVVVGIIGFALLGVFASRLVEDMGVNPDGSFDTCELVSAGDLQAILGSEATAMPLEGLVAGTIGQLLDKRVLAEAPDCWIISDQASEITGRLAQQDGNAAATFSAAKQAAQDAGYFAGDVSVGDEAFCTGLSEVGSFGILVRRGDSLAYVGLIDAGAMQAQEFEMGDDGVIRSPKTCALAGQIAEAVLR